MSLGIVRILGETKKHGFSTATVLRRSRRALSGCVRYHAGKHTPLTLSTRSVQDAGVPLLRLGEKETRRTTREQAAPHQPLRRDKKIPWGGGGEESTRQKNKAPARSRRKNIGPAIRAREKKHRGNDKSQRKSTTRSNTNSRVAWNQACRLTKSSDTTTARPRSQSTNSRATETDGVRIGH